MAGAQPSVERVAAALDRRLTGGRSAPVALLLVTAGILLVSGAISTAAVVPSPPVATHEHPIVVGERQIARETLRHWARIGIRSGLSRRRARLHAVEYLVFGEWIRGEARLRGITVRRAEVVRRHRVMRRKSFSRLRDYRRFLRSTGQTREDILHRVRLDLYSKRIRRSIIAGATDRFEAQRRLDEFAAGFDDRWRPSTACRPRYFSAHHCSPSPSASA